MSHDNIAFHSTSSVNLTAFAAAPKIAATISADGTVEIDWNVVEQFANDPNGDRTLWAACKIALAVRDGTAKSVGAKEPEKP